MPHKEIARYVREKFAVSGWWAQTITVGYERIRGLREKGQRRSGGYHGHLCHHHAKRSGSCARSQLPGCRSRRARPGTSRRRRVSAGGRVVRSIPAPVNVGARNRRRWLGETRLTIKEAAPRKSLRLRFEDGTPVEVYFWEKGPNKSQVQLQHRQRPSKSDADRIRTFWTRRLEALGEVLRAR